MGEKLKKLGEKLENKIDSKILLFKVFDEPRPKYITKVTLIDRIIEKVFLWAFPQSINPNHITVFRFITIPFIILSLLIGYYKVAFIMFVISALSDAIDGVMARVRNEVTDFGIVFDPLADKLLIGSVGGILIFKFIDPILAFSIIIIELILIISSYYRFQGQVIPAKTVGKVKMVLQCFGVGFIFLFLLTKIVVFLTIATYILYMAVIFAVLSLLIYKTI